jgi:ubiquitin-conjugating enzyme E2 G1
MASPAAGLLARQLKQMQSDKDIPGISCGLKDDNVFEWEVMLMIDDDCKYYGGTSLVLRCLSFACAIPLLSSVLLALRGLTS